MAGLVAHCGESCIGPRRIRLHAEWQPIDSILVLMATRCGPKVWAGGHSLARDIASHVDSTCTGAWN